MGAYVGGGRSCSSSPYATQGSCPNPKRFVVTRSHARNGFVIALVNYPDATNFEGHKILVYRAASIDDVIAHNDGELDPHFSDNGSLSPLARFEPTEVGLKMAIALVGSVAG